MVKRFVLLLILSLTHAVAAAAELQSKIDAVTVYPDGATVTRVAHADLTAGSNEIRLVGLVSAIDADRLQVEVTDPEVHIGQIKLSVEQRRDAYDTEVASAQSDIEVLKRKILAIDDSSNAAKLRLRFLDGIAEGYAKQAWFEGSRGTADVNSWRAALDLLQAGSEDANRLIRNNDVEQAALSKDLSVFRRKLADLRGGSLATAVVELTLNANRALRAEIRLRYFQENAYWSPRYESRLDSFSGKLQLAQQAEIKQQTDEDWSNVKLTLSTSEPDGELVAPELRSEFLDLHDPVGYQAFSRGRGTAAMSDETEMLEEITVTGTARANIGNFAVNYDVPGRASITNDSDDVLSIDLARHDFNAELVTQVVPRQNTQAFLAARFIYDQSLPLYAGSMAVFVDGVFVGNTQMPTALPQAEVILPMGQDRRIEVRSQTQGGAAGKEGIVNKRKTETTDYVFEITNRRGSASYVEVMDRYPVARNKAIEVEVPRSATPVDTRDIDDQPGLVLWKKTLEPGETWRIRHQYTIRYPAKSILSGQ